MRSRQGFVVLVLLLLVARVALALGPERMVLCVHGDGRVFVESTAQLCCARIECVGGRNVAADETPTGPDDDCQDYALSTGEPAIAHEPAAKLDLSASVAVAALAAELLTTAPLVALDARGPLDAPEQRVEPPSPRSTVLRC